MEQGVMNREEKIRRVCESIIDNSNIHRKRLLEQRLNCGQCSYWNCNEDFPSNCLVLLAREILNETNKGE